MLKKKIISLILITVLFATVMVAIFISREDYDLKIGVIGEVGLPNADGSEHLNESLKTFRNHHCDVIVISGKLTGGKQETYYSYFNKVVKNVFGSKTPIIIYPQSPTDTNIEIYNKYFGNEFEIIETNYANFLKLPYKTSIQQEYVDQVKIKLDTLKNSEKQTFIVSYTSPKNTFYGSEIGSESLKNLVNQYENVIWLSKGTYSQISKKATYNHNSNYYFGLEPLFNVDTPNNKLITTKSDARGIIFTIKDKKVSTEKWNFTSRKKESVHSLENYTFKTTKPIFKNKYYEFYSKDSKVYFKFSSATSEDFIFSYQIFMVYKNNCTQNVYNTEYYLGKSKMSNFYELEISSSLNGLKNITIIAIDDNELESEMWVCDYSLRNTDIIF